MKQTLILKIENAAIYNSMIIIDKLFFKNLKIAQKGTLINTGARSVALNGQYF